MSRSMAATETKEVKSKLQRALEMQAKITTLKEEAKAEALETVNQAIKDLKELGFIYRLLSEEQYESLTRSGAAPRGPAKAAPKAKEPAPGPSANYDATKRCETCRSNGHDGRKHRTHKEPFTNEELVVLGIMPPDLPIPAKA